jgi:RNA polymerase sigma-70 factor (ECF subfamily)
MAPRKNWNDLDDSELVELWLGGEEDAGKEIVRRYDRRLGGYFRAQGWFPQEVEDLKQETWRRVFRGMAGYRREVSLSIWIFIVARSVHWDALQAKGKLAVEVPEGDQALELPAAQPNAEENVQEKERNELLRLMLRRAIDELPPQQRRCLILRVYHELSIREIAKRMNLSEGAVRSHLSHARKKLWNLLKDLVSQDDFL